MYGETVKVYGEDLASGALTAKISGSDPVLAGGVMGALVANVFADGAVTVAADSKVEIKASATKTGSFTKVTEGALPAGTYADKALITSIPLPFDMDMWAMADVTPGSNSSGKVVVTLGYLPR